MYAATSQLGDINLKAQGGVYQVTTKPKDIGEKTRGVKIKESDGGNEQQASEFFEESVTLKTAK